MLVAVVVAVVDDGDAHAAHKKARCGIFGVPLLCTIVNTFGCAKIVPLKILKGVIVAVFSHFLKAILEFPPKLPGPTADDAFGLGRQGEPLQPATFRSMAQGG